ncbi:MAG: roadblock/LC7 domain-containing protein [Methanosarcinales archaeon]|nr:roadblock/LC7 domain-containing protein [Methanosarcinales archaeon]
MGCNMVTLKEKLEEILIQLESLGDIRLSAIISRHGLLMVSRATQDSDSEAFAALAATLHMSAESTTKRLSNEAPNSIVVETDGNSLITHSAGPNALIVVLASKAGGLGLILTELKKAAKSVEKLV